MGFKSKYIYLSIMALCFQTLTAFATNYPKMNLTITNNTLYDYTLGSVSIGANYSTNVTYDPFPQTLSAMGVVSSTFTSESTTTGQEPNAPKFSARVNYSFKTSSGETVGCSYFIECDGIYKVTGSDGQTYYTCAAGTSIPDKLSSSSYNPNCTASTPYGDSNWVFQFPVQINNPS